jgi:hypothetical protein
MRLALTTLCLSAACVACLGDLSVATIHLPDGQGSISLRREHAHMYLPEYRRSLTVELVGRPAISCDLPMDTGGTIRVELYPVARGAVIVRDRIGAYRAAGTSGPCQDTDAIPDGVPLGWFDEVDGRWTFVDAPKATAGH